MSDSGASGPSLFPLTVTLVCRSCQHSHGPHIYRDLRALQGWTEHYQGEHRKDGCPGTFTETVPTGDYGTNT
jgi:hypothetical protein